MAGAGLVALLPRGPGETRQRLEPASRGPCEEAPRLPGTGLAPHPDNFASSPGQPGMGCPPLPPKMPAIPQLRRPLKWHQELFLWGAWGEVGFAERYLWVAAPAGSAKGRIVATTRIVRWPCSAAGLQRGAWRVAPGALAFFPAPGSERDVSAAGFLAHAPTPDSPPGPCGRCSRGGRALLA